jgi:hypothetical protein
VALAAPRALAESVARVVVQPGVVQNLLGRVVLGGAGGADVAREALGNSGYARSLEFTWAASAQAHLACYERAASAGQG